MRPQTLKWILLIIAVPIIVNLVAPQAGSHKPAKSLSCLNNMRQISLALHSYRAQHDSFPPAYTVDENGQRMHSWRTLLLPFLDQKAVYDQIDLSKPWNHPVNKTATKIRLFEFDCPTTNTKKTPMTTYQALVGQDACLLPTELRNDLDTIVSPDKTLLLVEVSADKAVHWMDPVDRAVEYLLTPGPLANTPHTGYINAIFVDGNGTRLPQDISLEARQELISISKAKKPAVDRLRVR